MLEAVVRIKSGFLFRPTYNCKNAHWLQEKNPLFCNKDNRCAPYLSLPHKYHRGFGRHILCYNANK